MGRNYYKNYRNLTVASFRWTADLLNHPEGYHGILDTLIEITNNKEKPKTDLDYNKLKYAESILPAMAVMLKLRLDSGVGYIQATEEVVEGLHEILDTARREFLKYTQASKFERPNRTPRSKKKRRRVKRKI